MSVPVLKTRKPTGKPSWPILLLAGAEKAGKSYTAAQATSSGMIGRSYWVTIGEDQPDEYGQLGDFDIVEHDGTYRDILNTLRAIGHQPLPSTGVPLLIVDSMTRLWDLLKETQQNIANSRRGGSPDKDATITTDQWNAAASQWAHVMDAIRAFPGPVVLTARLDQVVMMENGQPTSARQSKVQGHKTLPYDVGGIVEMPARGEATITGLRSVRLQLKERTPVQAGVMEIVPWLWGQMGLEGDDTTPREHSAPEAEGTPFDAEGEAAGLDLYDDIEALTARYEELRSKRVLGSLVDGRPLGDLFRERKALLVARAEQPPMVLADPPVDPTDAYEDETPF